MFLFIKNVLEQKYSFFYEEPVKQLKISDDYIKFQLTYSNSELFNFL